MVDAVSKLTERLAEAKGDRSIDDIARRATNLGHRLSRSTVAKYLRDEQGDRPPVSTIDALAAGFAVDARELRRLAAMQSGELGKWTPPTESSALTRDQRDALDSLIKSIVRQGGSSDDRQSEAQKSPSPEDGVNSERQAVDGEEGASLLADTAPEIAKAARTTWTSKGVHIREQDEAGEENQDTGEWHEA